MLTKQSLTQLQKKPWSGQALAVRPRSMASGTFLLENGRRTMMKRTPSGHRSISVREFGGAGSAPLIIRCDEKDVKLTTYNILSPPLASPQQFPSCDQKDLLKEVRLPKIFARLQKAADEERIIALQEVDLEWAGKLHSFFAERGYAVVFAQYGKQTNGYMGVMLAWPTRCYEAVDVEICRLADTAPKNAWPVQKSKTGLARFGYLTYDGLTEILGCKPPELDRNSDGEWTLAQNRYNEAIFAKLKRRGTSSVFSVGTYHMPCLFGTTEKVRAVNIHSRLLLNRLSKFADGTPVALMGDFNFMPGTTPYQLLERGGSAEGIQVVKEVNILDRLPSCQFQSLQSAYKAFYGQEPLFTNYALSGSQQEPFMGTLDYIWFSPDKLKVVACEKLLRKEDVRSPFPNNDEPSDHLPLNATLRFI